MFGGKENIIRNGDMYYQNILAKTYFDFKVKHILLVCCYVMEWASKIPLPIEAYKKEELHQFSCK